MRSLYSFHGVRLAVDAGDPALLRAIDGRLRRFRSDWAGMPELTFRFDVVASAGRHVIRPPDGVSRPVYDSPLGEVAYYGDAQELYIDVEDRVRVRCSPGTGRVAYSVVSDHADLWLLSRPLFTLPLIELLKRRGRFSVHAAGVASDGRGILLPGASGSGKSTLAVALTRAGFDFLADDLVFLAGAAVELRVLAFPEEIDVTDQTASWFAELRHIVGAVPQGWPKHRVRHEDAFSTAIAEEVRPELLVFPTVGADEHSELHALEPGAALLELAPNVLLTDPAASQQHLDALADLVRATRCYRLVTGRDFERVAQMLRDLLP